MVAPLTIDVSIFVIAAALAVASIVRPSNRRLRIASVLVLVGVMAIYVIARPGGRAAIVYYEEHGGVPSQMFRDGLNAYQAVTWQFSVYVLISAVLLAVIALRRK
jgi:hypothetical protein